jgi:hypothetical protein
MKIRIAVTPFTRIHEKRHAVYTTSGGPGISRWAKRRTRDVDESVKGP